MVELRSAVYISGRSISHLGPGMRVGTLEHRIENLQLPQSVLKDRIFDRRATVGHRAIEPAECLLEGVVITKPMNPVPKMPTLIINVYRTKVSQLRLKTKFPVVR
jgi:hypothetical protein